MSDYRSQAQTAGRRVTLNALKDERYALNMRLLLAMQDHNQEAQEEITAQIAAVQAEIQQIEERLPAQKVPRPV